MESYLYGSYAVTLAAIIGYQIYIQIRLKSLSTKIAVIEKDQTHEPSARENAS